MDYLYGLVMTKFFATVFVNVIFGLLIYDLRIGIPVMFLAWLISELIIKSGYFDNNWENF